MNAPNFFYKKQKKVEKKFLIIMQSSSKKIENFDFFSIFELAYLSI